MLTAILIAIVVILLAYYGYKYWKKHYGHALSMKGTFSGTCPCGCSAKGCTCSPSCGCRTSGACPTA